MCGKTIPLKSHWNELKLKTDQMRTIKFDRISEVAVDYLDPDLDAYAIDVFGIDEEEDEAFVAGYVCNSTGKIYLPIPPALLQTGGGLIIAQAAEKVSKEIKSRLTSQRTS